MFMSNATLLFKKALCLNHYPVPLDGSDINGLNLIAMRWRLIIISKCD